MKLKNHSQAVSVCATKIGVAVNFVVLRVLAFILFPKTQAEFEKMSKWCHIVSCSNKVRLMQLKSRQQVNFSFSHSKFQHALHTVQYILIGIDPQASSSLLEIVAHFVKTTDICIFYPDKLDPTVVAK